MSASVRHIIETLFATAEKSGQRLNFSWRLIRRKGRPFMLLPHNLAAARTGLSLYSAQRWPAKIWRAALPLALSTPAANIFERIHFEADAGSEIMRFIAQQTGQSSNAEALAAIKLSEVGDRARLVLLLCDESGRPTRVIKAGLNDSGRSDTDREADFLAQLPPNTIGCIRITGRIQHPNLSAFSTDYFPGGSPADDAGMEYLFQAWLNTGSPAPLESLPTWQELDRVASQADSENWATLKRMLAGKTVRTTLYHGDFAPWNLRVISSRNLQAFDWERGDLRGIPGWDWFHFIIQTSILAKRYSTERVAAEVEQLLQSDRFKNYAAAAGITDIVRPLVLAYLLNHRWVIQPLEGRRAALNLFKFLAAHWQIQPANSPATTFIQRSGMLTNAVHQLKSAAAQWNNLFWEPTLNSNVSPTLAGQLKTHWRAIMMTFSLLMIVATTQYHASTHLFFLPFYALICGWNTWRVGRNWGSLTAIVTAVLAPVMFGFRDAGFRTPEVMFWNILMRFSILQMTVLFVDRIHQQKGVFRPGAAADLLPVKLAEQWAVAVTCALVWLIVVIADMRTDPHLIFLPLYLFPCMVMTLVLNLRWGIAFTIPVTLTGTLVEYFTNKLNNYSLTEVFGWNFSMRLIISLVVIILLDRIRRENILFRREKIRQD